MRWAPPLRAGAQLALVAPARYVSQPDIAPFLDFAGQQGWKILYDDGLFARSGMLAGTDEHRQRQLQNALDDPAIHAIWCARGGYGVSRIWMQLSWEGFRRYPKWLIGFSDITPLLWAAAKADVVALHAPVAAHIPHKVSPETIGLLLHILTAEKFDYTLSWQRQPWYAWRPGTAFGPLLGGNLTLLQTLCGTDLDIRHWEGQPILFWEEVGEYLYRADRASWHLHNAGWYGKISGLLVGGLTLMQDSEDDPFGQLIQRDILRSTSADLPLAMGLRLGHTRENLPVPVGPWAYLRVDDETARLRFWRSG